MNTDKIISMASEEIMNMLRDDITKPISELTPEQQTDVERHIGVIIQDVLTLNL